jgi:ketosteroid isomerase-like protein
VTSWSTTSVRVAASGDLAVEQGEIYMDPDGADGKEPATTGAYVTVWEKVDGAWRVFADSGTDNAKKDES